MNCKHFNQSLTAIVAVGVVSLANFSSLAAELAGNVQGAGSPIAGSTVTLYAASDGAPAKLAQGNADNNGTFKLKFGQVPKDSVLYVVAKGGTPKAGAVKGPNDAIGLMAVLGTTLPKKVTVNEFTTIASAMTCAQFLNGDSTGRQTAWPAHRGRQRPQFRGSRNWRLRCHDRRRAQQAQSPTMANFATLANVMAGASRR